MRAVGLFFAMLAVFAITVVVQNTSGGPPSSHVDPMVGVVLFFGLIVAIPVVLLLLLFDLISTRLPFPFSSLVYATLSVLCCAAVAFLIARGKSRPIPATAGEWLAALVEFSPVLTAACVPLARQIYRAVAAETSA
jgi:hypothetical protein